jgi:uncharacterized membrane protein
MKIREFYNRNKTTIFIAIFLAIIGFISVGCAVLPTIFYDRWIWKYYWGPVVADAAGHSASWNGVSVNEGYTLVSELTYGVILVVALYGIYKLLKKLKITIDWKFCLALMPYILFGPVTRVLEDTVYFNEPFVYWFISPLIYFQIAAYALFFLIVGWYIGNSSKKKTDEKRYLFYFASIFIVVDVLYTIIWILGLKYAAYIVHPLIFYLLSFLAFMPVLYKFFKKQTLTVNTVLFSGGLLLLLPTLYLTSIWILGIQWDSSVGVRFDVFLLVICLVSLIVGLVYIIAYKYRNNEKLVVYKAPLNLSMLFGHLVDGITSYISIYDPLKMGLIGYEEKHPASNSLMVLWPPLFPIMKFILIIAVIYVFDVLYKKELKNYMTLVNLLKIGILILGLSPGLRDLLRVTMGV